MPNQVIVRQGQHGHSLYFINRGVCKVMSDRPGVPGSMETHIDTLCDRDFFGGHSTRTLHEPCMSLAPNRKPAPNPTSSAGPSTSAGP